MTEAKRSFMFQSRSLNDLKDGGVVHNEFCLNEYKSTKYTWYSFLPKNLFEQFRRLANVFFLFVALLAFIPNASNIQPGAALVPILLVVTFTACKDAYEDLKRARADARINARPARVVCQQSIEAIQWKDIAVGDLIEVRKDEEVPADIVVVSSSLPSGLCFIETANLDGEVNLKVHEALKGVSQSSETIGQLKGEIDCELPNSRLYSFDGAMKINDVQLAITNKNVLLRGCVLRNVRNVFGVVVFTGKDTKLVRNSVLPPSKRSSLEKQIDVAIVFLFFSLLFLCFFASVSAHRNPHFERWYIFGNKITFPFNGGFAGVLFGVCGHMILFQQLIPLSLYVTLEMIKITQAQLIQRDESMLDPERNQRAISKNSNVTEELGQIQYIFSDKTGTLTRNEMLFHSCFVADRAYDWHIDKRAVFGDDERSLTLHTKSEMINQILIEEDNDRHRLELRRFWLAIALCHTAIVEEELVRTESPSSPMTSSTKTTTTTTSLSTDESSEFQSAISCDDCDVDDDDDKLRKQSTQQATQHSTAKRKPTKYQATSPDEIALVQAAASVGFEFLGRAPDDNSNNNDIYTDTNNNNNNTKTTNFVAVREQIDLSSKPIDKRYEILAINEFDSNRKRMSVLVRFVDNDNDDVKNRNNNNIDNNNSDNSDNDDKKNDSIRLLVKGADSAVLPLLTDGANDDLVVDSLNHFASNGLRTLCVAERRLSTSQAKKWLTKYVEASLLIHGRQDALAKCAIEIETDLELLGVTAIEDRLQEGVPESIETLARAGIKLWVLTGDKVETAISIGRSCNLIESSESNSNTTSIVRPSSKHPKKTERDDDTDDADDEEEHRSMIHDDNVALIVDAESLSDTARKLDRIFVKYILGATLSRMGTTTNSSQSDFNNSNSSSNEQTQREQRQSTNASTRSAKWHSLTLVVDGHSLEFILADSQLSANFLLIAKHCRSVICARASPLQKFAFCNCDTRVMCIVKSKVVNLVRKTLGVRTLAIGDGANDVAMIMAAHVGIGISGNEGRQAVLASDFAIAQFRFLVPLLLVHGRTNYKRLCKVILYSFYKNIAFVLCQFWFGVRSMYSANNIYDAYAQSAYNLAFTTLPLLMLGVFDRDIPPHVALKFPRLYESGLHSYDFSALHLVTRMFFGLVTSVWLYFACEAMYDEGVWQSNGQLSDHWVFGLTVYNVVVLTANVKIALMFRTWNVFHFVSIGLSFLAWYLFNGIYNFIHLSPDNYAGVPFFSFSTAQFWLSTILLPGAVLIEELAIAYAINQYFPTNATIIAEYARIHPDISDAEARALSERSITRAVTAADDDDDNVARPLQIQAMRYIRRNWFVRTILAGEPPIVRTKNKRERRRLVDAGFALSSLMSRRGTAAASNVDEEGRELQMLLKLGLYDAKKISLLRAKERQLLLERSKRNQPK